MILTRVSLVALAALVLVALAALVAPVQVQAKSDCAMMQRLAQEHSNDMARRESPDRAGFSDRAAKGARAENVAMGNKTQAETIAQWHTSPPHAANMRLPAAKLSRTLCRDRGDITGRWKSEDRRENETAAPGGLAVRYTRASLSAPHMVSNSRNVS
jgi:hypothetical protein